MLTLTENARTIIQDITDQPGAPETAGLRITTEDTAEPSFAVSAAPQAEPGDQVVAQGRATVYLDPEAATALDDKVLDAGLDDAGGVSFALGLQG